METLAHIQTLLSAGIVQGTASKELLFALFMVGFAGSATHCLGMCGPFVISQTQARLEAVPASHMSEFKRLHGAALAPYHLGRGTTYIALGAVASLLTQKITEFSALHGLAALLLGFAALFFFGYALRGFGISLPFTASRNASGGEGLLAQAWGRAIKPLFRHPVGMRGYFLGITLGFLPCGLLYGAVAAAATSGQAVSGAFAMAAFWLGTVPALLGLGLAGGTILGRWPAIARRIAPLVLLFNAAFLLRLAWRMV